MKIIDSHLHIGSCRVFDVDITEKELLSNMEKNGLTAIIVQPFPGAPDAKKVHDQIAKLGEDNPGKIFGLFSMNPHMDDEEYVNELERCVKDHNFVAVKVHTIGHALNPLGNDANKIFEAAKRLGIPVMVHTGPGVPLSLPSLVIPRANQYPEVPIILAHAGNGMVVSAEVTPTVLAAKNIYAETSWSSILEKAWFLAGMSSYKLIFGSDFPINTSTELFQFRELGLSEEDMEKILFKNANEIFKLRL